MATHASASPAVMKAVHGRRGHPPPALALIMLCLSTLASSQLPPASISTSDCLHGSPEVAVRLRRSTGTEGVTLAFVFDSTGSMSDELTQVKEAMKEIFQYMKVHRSNEIANFALVPFNDPSVGPVSITTYQDVYKRSLDAIRVDGGGDCPELSMAGIKLALERSLPHSFLFVFTDASAKDYNLLPEVENLIQRNKCKVIFVLTGKCSSENEPGYQAYYKIAEVSNGQVFNLHKNEVHKVLDFVKIDTGKKEVLASGHIPVAVKKDIDIPVDETVKVLTVTTTGKKPTISLKDPDGVPTEGEKILELDSVLSKRVKDPKPGHWSAEIGSAGPGRFVVTAESDFNFIARFSLEYTANINETAPRPLKGILNALLVVVTNQTLLSHLTQATIQDTSNNILFEIPLQPVSHQPGVYTAEKFMPPDSVFKIQVSGIDRRNNPIIRFSDSAISPQPPAKPIITREARVVAFKNRRLNLKCLVESLVPFTGSWMKGTYPIESNKSYMQSSEMVLSIQNVTSDTEDIYTCQAKNIEGTTAQTIKVTVKAPPPTVKTPSRIKLRPAKTGKVPCEIESELVYTVSWFKMDDSGKKEKIIFDPRFTLENSGNLSVSRVEEHDKGLYQCSAVSKSGEGRSSVVVEVKEPINVTVITNKYKFHAGEDVNLICKSPGKVNLFIWRKNGVTIKADETSSKSPHENTLIILNAERSDEGNYECEASNDDEKETDTVSIQYIEAPRAQLLKSFERVLIGNPLKLECQVSGIPPPQVEWFRNGSKMISSEEQVVDYSSLLIPILTFEHSGNYQCFAENEVGKAADDIVLEVGSVPHFNNDPQDVTIDIFRNGSFNCHAFGHPSPSFVWLRVDEKEIDPIRFSPGNSCSLIIQDAQLQDGGAYIVKAENIFGKSEKEFYLTITGIVKPVLSRDHEEEVAVSGRNKALTCIVLEGNPPPLISWYKDGEILNEEELASMEGKIHKNGSLIFSYIKPDNEGYYECEARNLGGRISKKISLSVLEPPMFVDNQHTILKVRRGNTIALPCKAHGKPKPLVFWRKDGKYISSSVTKGQRHKDGSLIISRAQLENNGTYECEVRNTAGRQKKTIDLLVEEAPKIVPLIQQQYPVKGEIVNLTCEVDSFPSSQITWLINGDPVKKDSVTLFSEDNSTISFPADLSSTGSYECVARNEAGEDRLVINITVTVPPGFEIETEFIQASVGEDITLSCYTSGIPPPDYYWQKYPDEVIAHNDSILTLENVQQGESGVYKCEVFNTAGYAEKIFIVKVNAPPIIHNDLPKIKLLKKGFNFDIHCLADGDPEPTIKWLKNGEPLNSTVGGEALLSIRNASQHDAGLYTCIATNHEGSDQKDLEISVEVPPTLEELESTIIEVNESEPVVIPCPAMHGNPPPMIRWLKNGRSLNTGKTQTHLLLRDNGKSLKLKITNANDSGIYTCVAANDAGFAQADINLQVLIQPHFVITSPSKVAVTGISGDPVTLNCSSKGNPKPKLLWFRNGHPLIKSTTPHITISEDGQVLTIFYSSVYDSGEYKCVANNNAGQVQRTFDVDIFGSPLNELAELEPFTAEWGPWSPWSECTTSCGESERTRIRRCLSDLCEGETEEWEKCLVSKCEVDGGWGSWSMWSPCSLSCGSGKRYRQRLCNNPEPSSHGAICAGTNRQHEICNTKPCPIDGSWSEWSDWKACSGPCTNSTVRRSRKCTNPAPAFGGKFCSGPQAQHRNCVQKGCPVDGSWSDWSSWTSCSATCGYSVQYRERTCNNPKPIFGGKPCNGQQKQKVDCKTKPCDDTPSAAILHLEGFLNKINISGTTSNVQISDMLSQRTVKSTYKRFLKRKPGWFPLLHLLVSPILWLTAFQKNEAINGYTLTKGNFEQKTDYRFDTGEKLFLEFKGEGITTDGQLKIYVDVKGDVPLFLSGTHVDIESYEEEYIQTGVGELYATSNNVLAGSGISIQYSWNSTISYSSREMLPSPVEKLSVQNIQENLKGLTKKLKHSSSAEIEAKLGCPSGFLHNSVGYCQDIDECSDRHKHNCHFTQVCVNAKGSYSCMCPPGLQSAPGTKCTDVDECNLRPAVCSHFCQNLEGSFKCLCPPGLSLQDNGTTCASDSIRGHTRTRSEDLAEWLTCPPGQVIVKGVCQDNNPCAKGLHMCADNEICLTINGFYQCVSVPCPDGYTRNKSTKSCFTFCNDVEVSCNFGASLSQTIMPIIVNSDGPVTAYTDITNLPLNGIDTYLHTSYRILENEDGNPFRVKIKNGVGVLYSQKYLPSGKNYRVVVVGFVHDEEMNILHSTKFVIVVRGSADLMPTVVLTD